MSAAVRYTVAAAGVAVIAINRPTAHNALNRDVQYEIQSILDTAENDPATRCLVVTGSGGKAFSAGWDIKELVALSPTDLSQLMAEREEWLWRWYSYPLPTIAAMGGLAYGAGAYLAACSDLRVGGPGTRFRITAPAYGATGLTWLLPEIVGAHRAKDILYTARVVEGQECRDVGLLTRYVPSDDAVLDAAVSLASEIAALPPRGVRDTKRLMRERTGTSVRQRYDAENRLIRAMDTKMSDIFADFPARRPKSAG
ncbi:enoyl-CoA hydratase/isomerase family protein [Mycolicibacterium thermoresistibile]